jgi:glycine hydroxymethyltransferase
MGTAEMGEIARLLKLTLAHTTPRRAPPGGVSRSRYRLEAGARAEVRAGVGALLERYPLYPELDLDLLLAAHPPPTAPQPEAAP